MRPRSRYYATIISSFCCLAALGVGLHFFASVRECRRLRADLSSLQARLDAFEQSRPLADNGISSPRPIEASSNFSHDDRPALRPRLLGRGRSGSWCYSDIRLPNGEVRRYYAKTNATPVQLLTVLSNIRADLADASVKQREGSVDPSE